MTITAILQQTEANCAVMVRLRERDAEKRYQYDVKPICTGSKRGWVALDITTASALRAVYNALSAEHKVKFDCVDLNRLVDLAWKHIK